MFRCSMSPGRGRATAPAPMSRRWNSCESCWPVTLHKEKPHEWRLDSSSRSPWFGRGGCGTVCEFHSPDATVVKKNIETCKRFVQLASDIGGRGVKVRPNGLPRDVPVERTLEQIGKALIPCGQAAAAAGVEIWVEVHGP